jgi:hypothetical protein
MFKPKNVVTWHNFYQRQDNWLKGHKIKKADSNVELKAADFNFPDSAQVELTKNKKVTNKLRTSIQGVPLDQADWRHDTTK